MKKTFLLLLFVCLLAGLYMACKKATTPTPLDLQQKPVVLSEQQLSALRAYKQSPHEIAFGCFGASAKPLDISSGNNFSGIPDSMDLVSCWGGIPTDSAKLNDMNSVQKNKGLRVVAA